jgi:LmbE family N-acetylglucosaminyl deacetylase
MRHLRLSLVTTLSFLHLASLVSASVFNCVGGSVYVVAHPDDDLLFQAPDLQTDVSSSRCVTTVFLTSGDSGTTTTYARSREAGSAAAYAQMAGVSNSWTS